MSLLDGYFAGANDLILLLRDARDRVQWAAKPFQDNEQIKARICLACSELRLPYNLVRAAWYEQIGPYQYPAVYNAWLALAQRRQAESADPLAFTVYVNEQPIEPISRAQADLAKAIAGLRKVG